MSGDPQVGMKYYQEIAPDVALDRAEVVSLDETLETPAGLFANCLRTREGTALNVSESESKTYAPGIGLIQDQSLLPWCATGACNSRSGSPMPCMRSLTHRGHEHPYQPDDSTAS
jgi:hypothetical protein